MLTHSTNVPAMQPAVGSVVKPIPLLGHRLNREDAVMGLTFIELG